MNESLNYLSESRLDEMLKNVQEHRERYQSGNFLDLAKENGWAVKSALVKVDLDALAKLDGEKAEGDARNSIIVYKALAGMTPALAMEEGVWTRLAHVECLAYARARWMQDEASWDEVKFEKQTVKHFFGRGLNGIRDDNAIARLWWNMHIATSIAKDCEKGGDSVSPEEVLEAMLKLADVRMNLVERSWTGARLPLSRNIVKMIRTEPWLTARGDNFKVFMKLLNREGGGILFEALPAAEADGTVERIINWCIEKARAGA